MINLLPRLESEFPWLHERPGTENDFYVFCQKHGVEVVFQSDVPHGVYVLADGDHYIFLNSGLSGWMLLYVMFHELAHYLFHAPSQSNRKKFSDAKKKLVIEFFDREKKRKNHIEAEQVASLILFPIHAIEEALYYGAHEVFPEVAELIAVRLECQKYLRTPEYTDLRAMYENE